MTVDRDPAGTAEVNPELWRSVAARLSTHVQAGRRHLLTEDVVRMETVLALGEAGVAPDRLAVEVSAPELGAASKLDLVIDPPAGVVIEFKYPRDPRAGANPDTMTFGHLLRDFVRVAGVAAAQRWVVQMLHDRLVTYLTRDSRASFRWVTTPGQSVTFDAAAVAALPETAVSAVGSIGGTALTATCAVATRVDADLTLFAYTVRPERAPTVGSPIGPVEQDARPHDRRPATDSTPHGDGARQAILASARRITTRTGDPTFTIAEVIADLHSHGVRYADRTIRTMLASHLNADSTGPGVAGYEDVRRVDRGRYRLTAE